MTDVDEDDISRAVQTDGYKMDFKAKLLPIELDFPIIPPLMRSAKDICDQPEPPSGRDGCKDCRLLDEMIGRLR